METTAKLTAQGPIWLLIFNGHQYLRDVRLGLRGLALPQKGMCEKGIELHAQNLLTIQS